MIIAGGLDLGQSQDHAALVLGRVGLPLAVRVGHVHQYPLKTSYAVVMKDVSEKINRLGDVDLAVDARGPGKPVIDMLAVLPGLRIRRLLAISNTSGKGARREAARPADPAFLERWSVPKPLLFRTLLWLIKSNRFRVGEIPEAERLKAEFQKFGFRMTERGYVKLDGVAGHDDILLATVMACWAAFTATEGNYALANV